jgi:hypothetical protein
MTDVKTKPATVAEPAAVDPALSITDFCTRLSETVVRPELIGAFAHVEQKAKRHSDTAANYRERFDAFINKPV